MATYNEFVCPQCGGTYQEKAGVEYAHCLVGGHWTPHTSFDRIPTIGGMILRCCHMSQVKIQGITLQTGCDPI